MIPLHLLPRDGVWCLVCLVFFPSLFYIMSGTEGCPVFLRFSRAAFNLKENVKALAIENMLKLFWDMHNASNKWCIRIARRDITGTSMASGYVGYSRRLGSKKLLVKIPGMLLWNILLLTYFSLCLFYIYEYIYTYSRHDSNGEYPYNRYRNEIVTW